MPPDPSETQRAELHKTIWRIANDLRGSVDGWDFKSYVLGTLFYRFISENLTSYINNLEREAGGKTFDYAEISDSDAEFGRSETVAEKGFFILPSELFQNVRKLAPKDENLNETLQRVFRNVEGSAVGTESEDDLRGLFDDLDVNSQKLGQSVAKRNEKMVKLLNAIGELPLGNYEDNSIDVFGDAYEYLMQMYASSAGKSGGEYYTPQEVSELLARITVAGKTQVNKVYDPACGSGSLLLKFAKVLGKENVRQGFFGQEVNLTTYNLARINMFLHDVNYEKFDIAHGDTLIDPQHWDDEPFEAIVSNPPYSIKWDGDSNSLLINDPRYAPAGVLAPKSAADLAFTMHMLSWLAVNGTAAIVEFPGVLYRGGAEQKIRKYLIDNNYIDTVIQLPPDLFFGTTIATCIIVLKKSKMDNAVLFIDASAEFTRVGNKNRLTADHQQRILDAFANRKDEAHFTRLVPAAEIAENNYNISVSSYVEKEDTTEAIDISALNAKIAQIVARQSVLRTQIDAIVADLEGSTV
jgi:type I restriction enzyme M protein